MCFLVLGLIIHLLLDLVHSTHNFSSVFLLLFSLLHGIVLHIELVLGVNIFGGGVNNRLTLVGVVDDGHVESRLLSIWKILLSIEGIHNLLNLRLRISINSHVLYSIFTSDNTLRLLFLICLGFRMSRLLILTLESLIERALKFLIILFLLIGDNNLNLSNVLRSNSFLKGWLN